MWINYNGSCGIIDTSKQNPSDLKLVTGKTNGAKLYEQPDGTEDDAIATTKFVSDSVNSYGSDNQIPFMNSAGDDFEYSSSLYMDGALRFQGTHGLTTFSGHTITMNRTSYNYLIASAAGSSLVFRVNGNSTNSLLLSSDGHVRMSNDNAKFYQGAGNDYSQYFDGADQKYVLSSGDFLFSGGDVKLSGKLGIGATTLTHQLELYDTGGTRMRIYDSGASTAGIILRNSNGQWGFNTISDGRFSIYDYNKASYRMYIDASGHMYLPADNTKFILGAGGDLTLNYDGTDGIIDTSVVNPSDLKIDCGTEKTIELQEVVHDDLQVNIGEIAGNGWFGAQWSDIVEYRGGVALRLADSTSNTYKFKFNAQIPHKYAEGEDINFHVHIGNNSTTTGDVVLKFTWEWSNIDGTYGGTTSETKTFSVDGVDGKHQVFGFSTALSGTGKKISSIVLAQVERVADNAADTFTEDLHVIGVDYHVPHNTMGSRQEWIK